MHTQADSPAQVAARPETGGLPTLVIIGAQKCGTSALWYYLRHHPDASVSTPKELDFFLLRGNWGKGVAWYKSQFDGSKPVRVDASPNYTAHPIHLGVMPRMADVLPDAKLIYLVRDPIDRMAAQWVHNYAIGRHGGELSELVRPQSTYVVRSLYASQIEMALAHYPTDRILVLDQRDLRSEREQTLRRIFTFAGLDPDFTHEAFGRERHKTDRMRITSPLGHQAQKVLPARLFRYAENLPPMKMPVPVPDVRSALPHDTFQLLRDDAKRFSELTGLDTTHWSVWT
jgi:hypothetical protein